jgi:hypothetical protein
MTNAIKEGVKKPQNPNVSYTASVLDNLFALNGNNTGFK